MKRVLQLGGGVLMSRSIRKIQELGYEVYCVDMNPQAPAFAFADGAAAGDLRSARVRHSAADWL